MNKIQNGWETNFRSCLYSIVLCLPLFLIGCSDDPNVKKFADYRELQKQEAILKNAPNDYDALLNFGKLCASISNAQTINQFTKNKYKKLARENLTKAIRINPHDYRAYLERSYIGLEMFMRVPRQNIQDVEKAIELAPENADCFYRKVTLLIAKGGHLEEAVHAYEIAIDIWKRQTKDLSFLNHKRFELLQLYLAMNDENKAARILKEIYTSRFDENDFVMLISSYHAFYYPKNSEAQSVYNDLITKLEYKRYRDKYKNIIDVPAPTQEQIKETRSFYSILSKK